MYNCPESTSPLYTPTCWTLPRCIIGQPIAQLDSLDLTPMYTRPDGCTARQCPESAMYNCPCMINQSVAHLNRWAAWTNWTAWPLSWFITGPACYTGIVAVFLVRVIGLLMVVLVIPALLCNGSSSYATGHLVKHPDRGWASKPIYMYMHVFS